MSWDYALGAASMASEHKLELELSAQLPVTSQSQMSSFSSASTHQDEEMMDKLLPHNLWADQPKQSSSSSCSNSNTAEEQRFLQSQLASDLSLWYASDFGQHERSSSSASSVFEMKHQHQRRTQNSTPASSTTPTPLAFSSVGMSTQQQQQQQTTLQQMQPQMAQLQPQIAQLHQSQQQQQQQQQLQQPQQPQQQQSMPFPQVLPLPSTAQMLANTQTMLQNYQQQQVYLEQLQQQQQQQQAQLLQNPLFFQQQAQLVSQQLQQLQLQLQIQQQQIESLNAKKLEADKLPLTHENLNKLEQPSDRASSQTQAKSSHSSDNKSTGVNTDLYKTELCTTFQKTGACPYGNKCQFAHGENELKRVERGSKWRSKPCANWSKTGSCRYGNRCCFKHE